MEPTSSNNAGPLTIPTKMETEMLKRKVAELEIITIEHRRRQEERERLIKQCHERMEYMKMAHQAQIKYLEEKNQETRQRVNFLGGKCVKLMIENEKMKTDNHRITEELNLIKLCEDGEKAKKIVEEERDKASECFQKMLKAQEQLRKQQEASEGELKPWRLCQICDVEYSEVRDHSPRMLFCGHTFCYSCCLRSAKDRGIQCPYCRSFSPVDKAALEEELVVNFVLLHM